MLRKEELLSQQERDLQRKEADIQSAKRGLAEARGKLQTLERQHEESCRLNSELEIERYGNIRFLWSESAFLVACSRSELGFVVGLIYFVA